MSSPTEDTNVSFTPSKELETIQFWKRNEIYQKSQEMRKDAPAFVFYEGPPTANGLPHPGHCLTRAIKDLYPRYKTMQGFRVDRKAGWDTHGLPVEVEVCKELGIHSKEDIENYGIEPFVHKCIESVFRYTKQWEELTDRIGFWIRLDDAYVTYHKSYVESVWWSLKTLFDQGLWVVLILGLVFLLLPGLGKVGGWMAKIGAIGLVLTQGRNQKNIFLKLGAGLASLYNISGILGDVLSYSRLLALGLATGVIANVVNMVAKMALDFPYGIGYVVMIIVLLGGHAFNLFINAMGSYVHTSRLQYVEFFGKFFEGGGKLFSPFKIQQKYTYFKEDEEEA